jgi:hypothetical protein
MQSAAIRQAVACRILPSDCLLAFKQGTIWWIVAMVIVAGALMVMAGAALIRRSRLERGLGLFEGCAAAGRGWFFTQSPYTTSSRYGCRSRRWCGRCADRLAACVDDIAIFGLRRGAAVAAGRTGRHRPPHLWPEHTALQWPGGLVDGALGLQFRIPSELAGSLLHFAASWAPPSNRAVDGRHRWTDQSAPAGADRTFPGHASPFGSRAASLTTRLPYLPGPPHEGGPYSLAVITAPRNAADER